MLQNNGDFVGILGFQEIWNADIIAVGFEVYIQVVLSWILARREFFQCTLQYIPHSISDPLVIREINFAHLIQIIPHDYS